MRAIKFRAWDEENSQMYYLSNKPWTQEGVSRELIIQFDSTGYFARTANNNYYCSEGLMQFTGLVDSRSKEIYEGDIVKSESWGRRIVEFDLSETQWIARYFERSSGHWNISVAQAARSGGAVIGNIYENKDLLVK